MTDFERICAAYYKASNANSLGGPNWEALVKAGGGKHIRRGMAAALREMRPMLPPIWQKKIDDILAQTPENVRHD